MARPRRPSRSTRRTDDAAGNTVTKGITVNNVKPTPTITAISGTSGTSCLAGNTVSLSFAWTDPAGANDTYSYDIAWGDGAHTIAD